ncbi:MAG: DUF6077 domain-containing protein [Ruminococcus sp.]|nr:DUF6077 domain-containing protein [Ruminococcus sp.]
MIQIITSVFWLLAIPFGIGLIPCRFLPKEKKNPGVTLLAGYLLMWAVFEIITVPAVIYIQYDNFQFVLRVFTVAAMLLAAAGIVLCCLECIHRRGMYEKPLIIQEKPYRAGMEARIEWVLFFIIAGFTLYMSVTRASFDGDDAYYVAQSLMAQQNGSMYRNNPYTGRSVPLDARHALAVFPMWIAFVAVQADIHATIVSHVVMPLLLIPLACLIYYEIAKVLFADKKENIPVFMIVMALFQMFGNVSIYTNETFFLTRTWQGKSVAGSFVIPMLFLLLLWLYAEERERKEKRAGFWIMLVCLHVCAGMCSSIAVFLIVFLLATAAFCLMITRRDIKVAVMLGATCIPSAVYVLFYLLLK